MGAVVQNAGTTLAVYEAVQKNKPLIERVVTVTGRAMSHTANLKVRIGHADLVADRIRRRNARGHRQDRERRPDDGPAVANPEAPVTKGTSGILLIRRKGSVRKTPQSCIKCAKCVGVCPMGLEPYLMYGFARPVTLRGARSGPYHGLHRVRLLFLHLSCLPAAAGLYPAGQVGSGQNSPGAKSPIG